MWLQKLKEGDFSGPKFPEKCYLRLRGQDIQGHPRGRAEYQGACLEAVGLGLVIATGLTVAPTQFAANWTWPVVGALLGFLWFNAHPASVFMGDTGALPLGAALATVALMTGHWLLLPVIGVVFVAEALSDVIQIAYFKTTGGRRLFRKTPLHHHLELLGWSEPQVVI